MRVLHVIGGDDTGGAMSYLLPLLAALRKEGCDARVLCLGRGGLAQAAAGRGLPYAVIPMSHPWDARALAPLRHQLSAGDGWQVVHTHGMRANFPVRLVLPGLQPRPLLFTTVHSELALDYSGPLKSRAYTLLDRTTREEVDVFCCVSSELARRLVAQGVPESRVRVVHPGIEVEAAVSNVGSEGPAGLEGRAKVGGASRTGATIGTVARLVPVKDLELLLGAVALVAEKVSEVRLVVVGDGPERAALEHRAAQQDLAGRVEFLGAVTTARPILPRFDVYASSSESEGIPISVLEAMAMGLPVVATAVGGLPEAVRDGMTGFLVERRLDRETTTRALAGRLGELLSDAGMRERMGAAGRERVIRDFSSRAMGLNMTSIYRKALRQRGAPRPRRSDGSSIGPAVQHASSPWPALSVLGFRLDLVGLEEAASWVVRAGARQHEGAGESAGLSGGAGMVIPGRTALAVSFNPEFVMRACNDWNVGDILRGADLNYPDGVGAVWAARRALGRATGPEEDVSRVAGIDLAQRVLELAAEAGLGVYFLGAKPGVAEEAARRQQAWNPGLRVAGHHDGYFDPSEEESITSEVRRSGADILLVAMGAPRQETLLFDHRDQWGVGVGLGVGGSFDVWAGNAARAPEFVRKAGAEWLYRLIREPKRIRRQLVLPRYAYRVIRGGDE